MRSSLATLISAALSLSSQIAAAQDSVQYEFEFVAEWSMQTHPTSFPNNPHFSPVIGATHNPLTSLWAPGAIASDGIERMAETGGSTPLRNEVLAMIDDGHADQFLSLGGIALSPNSLTSTISVNRDHPMLSLVTMIAPSPDWFVGVHGIDLRADGFWVRELVFDLVPYDSGTDAGINYTSANSDLTPHLPIADISNEFPFAGSGRIGTFRVSLVSEAGCSAADLAEPFGVLDFFDVSVFVNAYSANNSDADFDNNGTFDFFDVSAFLNTYNTGCP